MKTEVEFDRRMLEALICPQTRTTLVYEPETQELVSKSAGLAFPIRNGIPVMLVDEARKLAGTLGKKGPLALRLAAQAIRAGEALSLDEALDLEAHLFGVTAATADCAEGLAAFAEKRKPVYTGK